MKPTAFSTFYQTLHLPYRDKELALYTKMTLDVFCLIHLPIALWYGAAPSFYLLLGGMVLILSLNLNYFRHRTNRVLEYVSSALLLVLSFQIFQRASIGYFSVFFLLTFLFCNVFVLGIVGSLPYSLCGFLGMVLCLNGVVFHSPAAHYDADFILRLPFLFLGILGIAYIIMFFIQRYWLEKQQRHKILQHRIADERAKLSEMSLKVITAMYSALSSKVPEVDQHCEQVGELTKKLATRMGLDEDACRDGYYAGLLHEVGTVGLPDAVLQRRDLTDEQFQLYQTYVDRGYKIIRELQIVDRVAETVRCHRERYDGTGYRAGLKGDAIPLLSRILAVADFTDRHRRRGETDEQIAAELTARAGTEFDPQCVEAMKKLLSPSQVR